VRVEPDHARQAELADAIDLDAPEKQRLERLIDRTDEHPREHRHQGQMQQRPGHQRGHEDRGRHVRVDERTPPAH